MRRRQKDGCFLSAKYTVCPQGASRFLTAKQIRATRKGQAREVSCSQRGRADRRCCCSGGQGDPSMTAARLGSLVLAEAAEVNRQTPLQSIGYDLVFAVISGRSKNFKNTS